MNITQVFEHYPRISQSTGEFRFCPFCGRPMSLAESGGRPRPSCLECGFVQYQNPSPAVSVLIVDEARVLLGKRSDHPGKGTWALPSGYIEYEDDFLSAAIREAKEETGLDVELLSIINVVSSFITSRFHFLGVYIAARAVGGQLAAADDLSAVAWFPLAGPLPEMGFVEDLKAIELYNGGLTCLPVDPDYGKHRL